MEDIQGGYNKAAVQNFVEVVKIAPADAFSGLLLFRMLPTEDELLKLFAFTDKAGDPIAWPLLSLILVSGILKVSNWKPTTKTARWKLIKVATTEGWQRDDLLREFKSKGVDVIPPWYLVN